MTELDEWAILSDSDEEGSLGERSDSEKNPKKKAKKNKVQKLAKRKGSDGEVYYHFRAWNIFVCVTLNNTRMLQGQCAKQARVMSLSVHNPG